MLVTGPLVSQNPAWRPITPRPSACRWPGERTAMRVLVLGAGGFIGGRIAAGLLARGHDVVPCGRDGAALSRRYPGHRVVEADLARDGAPEWRPRLAGVDAVVNAAGVLGGAGLAPVHT